LHVQERYEFRIQVTKLFWT